MQAGRREGLAHVPDPSGDGPLSRHSCLAIGAQRARGASIIEPAAAWGRGTTNPDLHEDVLSTHRQHVLTTLLAVVLAGVSAVGGYALYQVLQYRQQPEPQALLVLPEPRSVPVFELTDQHGTAFGPDRLAGRWSLWFFGFTHCPDICPGTLFDLKHVSDGLRTAAPDGAEGLQVIFVSVDPERDRPERLRAYLDYFDPGFVALTGPHDRLEPLTRALGIAYRIEPHEAGAASYAVDHSASVLLTAPDGRLYGVFPAPHDAALIQADLIHLLEGE
jgi:protein SCO1/2